MKIKRVVASPESGGAPPPNVRIFHQPKSPQFGGEKIQVTDLTSWHRGLSGDFEGILDAPEIHTIQGENSQKGKFP
jgi:hypothetical protein